MESRVLALDLHLKLAPVDWWVFTLVLGVALLIYGLVKKSWAGITLWVVAVVGFTIVESFLHHEKVVRGGKVSHPSNWKLHFDFSTANWWIFQIILFVAFVVLGFTKKTWGPLSIMVVLAVAFGLYYGLK